MKTTFEFVKQTRANNILVKMYKNSDGDEYAVLIVNDKTGDVRGMTLMPEEEADMYYNKTVFELDMGVED